MLETETIKEESIPPMDIGSSGQLDISEDKLQDLGTYLQKRFLKLKELRESSQWEKDKADAFEDYHLRVRPRPLPFPGAANLPCPLPRIGVDAFHANVMSSLFSEGNQMKIVPLVIQKEFAHSAERAAKFMSYVMNVEADSYLAFDDSDKKDQTYGIGYLEPTYVKEKIWETVDIKETKRTPIIDPQTQEVTFKKKVTTRREKKKRTVFDGVKINSIPVESVYVSPFVRSLEEAVRTDFVFKLFSLSFDEVKMKSKSWDGEKSYYKKAQVDKIQQSIYSVISKKLNDLEQARALKDGFFIDLLCKDENVELCEAYGWWDIDGDDIKEQIRVTFQPSTGIVLRVSFSKCRIVEYVSRPVDGRFYGEGIPKISESICDEWENYHNTRSNAGQWENTTFGFYRAGGRFNPSAITIKPGQFYPVDDPREVVFAQPPRVGSSYFTEEQLLMNYFERIFALDENMQGVQSSRRSKTATETMSVSSRASIRFSNPFNRIVTQTNKLLDHIWELNQECAPEDKEFYIMGSDGVPQFDRMTKGDYNAKLKFKVVISSVFDRQLTRDTTLMAYRLFLVNPFVQQHPEVMWDLSQKTLDALSIQVELPKPDQAKALSAYEALEIIRHGDEPIEPEVGIDYDHHIKVCMAQLNADDIKEWDHEAVMRLAIYIDKCKILKQTLESANLNKSGQYTGNPMPGQPALTANRNPTQMFNTMKVGESGKSARANNKNAMQTPPAQGGQGADQVLGPI